MSSSSSSSSIPQEQHTTITQPTQPPLTEEDIKSSILTDNEPKDQNTALNFLIHYITVAQKRGVFNLQESAHIWSCIKLFVSQQPSSQSSLPLKKEL